MDAQVMISTFWAYEQEEKLEKAGRNDSLTH